MYACKKQPKALTVTVGRGKILARWGSLFPLFRFLRLLSPDWKRFRSMPSNNVQHLFIFQIAGSHGKRFEPLFWGKLTRTRVFQGNQISILLLDALSVTFWTFPHLSGTCKTEGDFCSPSRRQTLLLQVDFVRKDNYLKVPLMAYHPDFARCSSALHRHVVSGMIRWLTTSASLALSTSAAMFYFFLFDF